MLCLDLGQPTPSILIFLVLSMVATIFVFNNLNSASDAYWMLPMIGFAQLSLFAGYSFYFPELFPPGCAEPESVSATIRCDTLPHPPILLAYLSTSLGFRTGASLMTCVYILGIVALI